MKIRLFLLAGLVLAGGLNHLRAQQTDAENAAGETTGDLLYWSQPDTVYASKAAGAYAMYVYTYDERGNAVTTEAFQYAGGTWLPSQRIDAGFNRFDLIDTTTSYLYQNGGYVPNARKVSTYDKQGRRITLLNAAYSIGLQTWQATSRYTYTYTEEDLLQSVLQEESEMYMTDWKKTVKTEYTYDAEGRELSFEMSIWRNEWQPYRGYYRIYENGHLVKELGRIVNELTGRYGDTYRYEYTYDERNNLTDYIVFYTDSTGKWDTNLYRVYAYNEQNLVSEEFTRVFDEALGEMENSTREYYFYNADGLKDSVSHESWLSYEWSHTVSYRYFYNEDGIRNGWIYYNLGADTRRTDKYALDFDANGNGTLAQSFTLQNNAWVPVDRYDLEVYKHDGELILRANTPPLCEIRVHYAEGYKTPGPLPDTTTSDTTTANDVLCCALAREVSVYPNPAVETLYVTASGDGVYDLQLTTLSGMPVMACRMTAGRKALDVSQYTGIHILRISKGGIGISQKIILL